MTHTVLAIQARTSSTRLPGKVLCDLAGRPLILRVVDRAGAAELVDEVWVVTSDHASDDPLAELCEARGVRCLRGPLDDVAARYEMLLELRGPDYVVRVTGDCPLIEPAFVDLQIAALAAFDGDLVAVEQHDVEGVLGGQTAMSARALRSIRESIDPRDREHVGSFWLARRRAELRNVMVSVDPRYARPGLRLQVDEPKDLELVRAIYARFAPQHGSLFPLLDVLAWLDEHPALLETNAGVVESADNRALRALKRETAALANGFPFPVVGRYP